MGTKFKKLTPDLMVRDVAEAVKFYTTKLGFRIDMLVPEKEPGIETQIADGKKYAYASVRRDEVFVMFMLTEAYAKDVPALKGVPIGASATFYFDVDNVQELYDSCKGKGVEIVKDLYTAWYGMKEFYARDCNGYILGFAEQAERTSK
ncbi:MAG: VOC family protein [Candidatus Omnitrophota bacterium]